MVIIIGGQNETTVLSDVSIYIINTTIIHTVGANLPNGIYGHTCSVIGNQVFLFGGFDGTTASSSLWIYNPGILLKNYKKTKINLITILGLHL